MSKHAQVFLDTAVDRAEDAERDRRFMSGAMYATATELGTVASNLDRLADEGATIDPREIRKVVAGLKYIAGELRESSRYESN